MVGLADALVVTGIEEEFDVALMRRAMVDHGCGCRPAFSQAALA